MKKSCIKILALTLVVAMACVLLVSCGKTISGEYVLEAGDTDIIGGKTTYKFSGKNVTITVVTGIAGYEKTTTFDGTYEITEEDGKEYITFTFEDDDAAAYSKKSTFEKTDDGIKIGGVELTKKK